MNLHKKILVCVAVVATFATSALAELSRDDRQFIEDAAKAGMKEFNVSQQALANLTVPEVRSAAQMMLSDHMRTNAELQALARQKGVVLPMPDAKVTRRWSENTKDVEDEYLSEMNHDHKDVVDLYEKAAVSEDQDIAAFAQRTLPTLRHHLAMVRELKRVN